MCTLISYHGGSEAHPRIVCRHGTRPFNDPCLIMAQVLSLIVLILSIFNELAWMIMLFLGLPAFILIQTACCCAMNRCGFMFAGVLTLVGACILLLLAITLSDILNNCGYYDYSSYDDDYGYDFCNDEDRATIWMILSFASGLLWATTGILVLVFACGKRYQNIEDQLTAEGAEGAAVPSSTAVAKYPVAV
jgi:hypothetical protein